MQPLVTVPNALTALRALLIPIFVYLALNLQADGWAIFVLAIGGFTDYFDGKIARAWGQESRFGELADPAIDRIYIVVTLIVLYLRDALPLWIIVLLLSRDFALGVLTIVMRSKAVAQLRVNFLGKAATFNLMYAFPFLLLATHVGTLGNIAFVLGWSFAIWGIALYIATGISYMREGVIILRLPRKIEGVN